jgi:hypothetical protein
LGFGQCLTHGTAGQTGDGPTAYRPSITPMRAVFFTYLVVIVSGITYFSVIGLTHH